MKPTTRISLKHYGGMKGLEDREDIIKRIVNMEDKADPYVHQIPKMIINDNLETPSWFVTAFSFDVGKYLMSCLP